MKHWRQRTRRIATHATALAAILAPLAGCGHSDPIDTPADWWHQLEGGRIAQDRPPPPGAGAPYPLVGTTPTKPPVIPTPQERLALTNTLSAQRNEALRRNTEDPLPPPGTQVGGEPPPNAKPGATPAATPNATPATSAPAEGQPSASATVAAQPAPAAEPNRSSAVFAAATPTPTPPPAPPASKPAASKPSATPADADGPLLAMPALQTPAPVDPNGPIPEFAPAPPPIPWLHGITVTHHEAPKPPDIPPLVETGTPVAFDFNADTLQNGEGGQLHGIAAAWRKGTITVHGYGDAVSAQPQAQIDALDLAWRRARVVGKMLVAEGVPQSAVVLAADAFGHDVRVVSNP